MAYPQYYFPFAQQMQPTNYSQPVNQPVQSTPQIQNGGFVAVPNEETARNYPVAPGTSITFKNENAPYVYTKTMGFSQLDRPIFEKFKLVKEEEDGAETEVLNNEADNKVVDDLKAEIKALWDEINAIKQRPKGNGDRHGEQPK